MCAGRECKAKAPVINQEKGLRPATTRITTSIHCKQNHSFLRKIRRSLSHTSNNTGTPIKAVMAKKGA